MRRITIPSPVGDIHCEQFGETSSDAIIWFFGAGGGFGGPAGGVYTRLGEQLAHEQIGSLCVDYRRPGYLQPCVADASGAVDYLSRLGAKRILLVGHSFGGAVVIRAGLAHAARLPGRKALKGLSPRPLLLIHGENDEILPVSCPRDIYRRTKKPKQIIVYPGCLHGLDQCATRLDRDLMGWIRCAFAQ